MFKNLKRSMMMRMFNQIENTSKKETNGNSIVEK